MKESAYVIHSDVKFEPLELIDVSDIVQSCEEDWFNQSLCRVNDSVVRMGILEGKFHWHKHNEEDEFFYVIDGLLSIDLEGTSFDLKPKQGFLVPKGVMHRTRAIVKTVVLMIEGAGVEPIGD